MAFEMTLWRVAGDKLDPIPSALLEQEQRPEDWIAKVPAILGMDNVLIGRQVRTALGARLHTSRHSNRCTSTFSVHPMSNPTSFHVNYLETEGEM